MTSGRGKGKSCFYVSLQLQLYDPPVLCVFNLEISRTAQHIFAHVREHQPPASEPLALVQQRPIVEMVLDLFVEEIRFAHEEICLPSGIYQILAPFCVTGIRDHLASVFNA